MGRYDPSDIDPSRAIRFGFALNDEVGFQMAINGASGGTPEPIHNGTDNSYWTGSNIQGTKVDFAFSGPLTGLSVEVNKPAISDIWQFMDASTTDTSNFIGLSMTIQVDSGWTVGNDISVCGHNTLTGLPVGNSVLLSVYLNEQDFGLIQKLAIPLSDMGLESGTIDSIRMEVMEKTGAGIVCHIDDIQLEETSGSKVFRITAPDETNYFISELKFTYIDQSSTVLADNSMPNISYDQILGLSKLTNGIGFSTVINDVPLFTASVTCIADSTRGGSILENVYSDGTNTHITVATRFEQPVLLKSSTNDAIEITVNDD